MSADKQSREEETGSQEQEQSAEHKSLPTEVESLNSKIAELETAVAQLKDQLLRKAAEFENYKKRTENDLSERIKFANEELLFELLPVIDDFERSLKMSKERNTSLNDDVLYRGADLIFQKFIKILETQGMKHYEVVGKQFDAYLHDALMQMPKEGVPPHTIIEEVEKGYTLHGKVLRHAKVIVAEDAVTEPIKKEDAQEADSSANDGQEK